MKNLTYIVTMFFLTACTSVYCQEKINIKAYSYEYQNEQLKDVEIYCLEIDNDSTDNYVTWISSEPVEGLSDEQLIRNYFFKRKGDFSLASLIYEGLKPSGNVSIDLDFIKSIGGNELFTYYVPARFNVNFYRERIVLLKRGIVEDYIEMKIPDDIFWQKNAIILMND